MIYCLSMASSSKRRLLPSGGSGWSDGLPHDILVNVFGCLRTLQDFFTVRAVCQNWRKVAKPSAYTLSSQSPLLVVMRHETETLYDLVEKRPYSLQFPWAHPDRSTYAYSHGQLIIATPFDQDSNNSSILLSDLFTGATTLLPLAPFYYNGVVLSAHPDSARCLVVLFELGKDHVQFLTVGDTRWTVERSAQLRSVRAMKFFQGGLVGLTSNMELLSLELKPFRVRKLGGGPSSGYNIRLGSYWLGECDGVLLAVCNCYPAKFKVFQWNSEKKGWAEIHDLGDKSLFIGASGDVVLISLNGLGLRKNCVYSSGHHMKCWGEFSLANKSYKEVKVDNTGLHVRKRNFPVPVWVFPSNYREMNVKELDNLTEDKKR